MKTIRQLPQPLRGERGATSVLVIFMMIVLVTLGAFAITSANVNYKFSARARDWTRSYYTLEDSGETFAKDFDLCLAAAENDAIAYGEAQGYAQASYDGIPDDIQNINFTLYSQGFTARAYAESLERVYDYFVNQQMQDFAAAYPDVTYSQADQTDQARDYAAASVAIDFVSVDNADYHLRVALTSLPFPFEVGLGDDGSYIATRTAQTTRYAVQSWNQWQTPVQLDNSGPQLWNGDLGSGNPFFDNNSGGSDGSGDILGNPAQSQDDGSIDLQDSPAASDGAASQSSADPGATDDGDTIEIIGN